MTAVVAVLELFVEMNTNAKGKRSQIKYLQTNDVQCVLRYTIASSVSNKKSKKTYRIFIRGFPV